MGQQRLEDPILEQLWKQWLAQVGRVVQCAYDCDEARLSGRHMGECRAANLAEWTILKSVERAISAVPATNAYGVGIKLAIWRHWRDPGEGDEDDDPALFLIRSSYRTAVKLSGIDFGELIRRAERTSARRTFVATLDQPNRRTKAPSHISEITVIRVF